jgi:hypothetical protein
VQTEERRKKALYNAWILRFLQDEMKQVRKPIIGRRFTWLHVTLAHRGRSIATGVSVMARGMGRPSRRPGTRVYCTSWCTGVPGQRPGTVYTRVVDRDRFPYVLIRPFKSDQTRKYLEVCNLDVKNCAE